MSNSIVSGSRNQPDFEALVTLYGGPGIVSMILMGSYARGEASRFSDVDLVRFHAEEVQANTAATYLVEGFFVVVSDVGPSQVEAWFNEPDQASATISGLRNARPLWDPEGHFVAIQERAKAFTWDAEMQTKANAWASDQMVGWIEEAQKGLAGLSSGHEGRLLNARFGLTWGMINVLRVQRGILISGDNGTYPEVIQDMEPDSTWAELSRIAFGMDGQHSLTGQVAAGLRLYAQTAALLAGVLKPEDKRLVDEVARRIRAELPGESDQTAN